MRGEERGSEGLFSYIRLEERIAMALRPQQAVVITHLEPFEGHGDHHAPIMGRDSRGPS